MAGVFEIGSRGQNPAHREFRCLKMTVPLSEARKIFRRCGMKESFSLICFAVPQGIRYLSSLTRDQTSAPCSGST